MEDLSYFDATALAELVKRREIKAIELIDATIGRIETLNPKLNAVITPMYEEARKKALGPSGTGPFAGVPFLLKDLLASYKGVRMTFGTKNLSDFIPDHDSELVTRYKKAGFIVLGKTNIPELGLLPTTEPDIFGPCKNPWDVTKTTGGSSGGSAAAVASRMVPAAHGNDGGGSIRIPASCCGLFGLKPTRGRNPLGPDFGDLLNGFVAEHVLTRSVRDSAAILDATKGFQVGDPYCAPYAPNRYSDELEKDPGKLRIAVSTDPGEGSSVSEDCLEAVNNSVKLLADLGHDIIEVSPDLDRDLITWAFTVIWASGCASTINAISSLTGRKPSHDEYEPVTWGLYEMGNGFKASDYLHAVQVIQRISRSIGQFFVEYDVLLTPVLAEAPVTLGSFDSTSDDPLRGWRRAGEFVPFTPLCNATGQPAMSVPLFWNAEGLPIGVHFVGRFGDEATLFRLASQLEKAKPWKDRKPPIS
ncbi:MAG: amidase [Syntrophales bacterium]|nr:amidase [Syntrophales bacterium]MDY0043847.1 amidase [Syntrophales bacterium]